jgi:hypothetical protein
MFTKVDVPVCMLACPLLSKLYLYWLGVRTLYPKLHLGADPGPILGLTAPAVLSKGNGSSRERKYDCDKLLAACGCNLFTGCRSPVCARTGGLANHHW